MVSNEALSIKQLVEEAQRAYKRGDYLGAGRGYEAAAESYQLNGELVSAAEMLNNSSVAYLQSGDGDAALRVVKDTPAVFAQAGDLRRQGIALGNLGSALEAVGSKEAALEAYRQSADLLKQVGEDSLRANVMQSISALQMKTGHQLEALATMQSGIEGLKHPSPKQRILKRLLNLPFKLMNGS
jgi:tetratricopeptide (TPR) repeat protein